MAHGTIKVKQKIANHQLFLLEMIYETSQMSNISNLTQPMIQEVKRLLYSDELFLVNYG